MVKLNGLLKKTDQHLVQATSSIEQIPQTSQPTCATIISPHSLTQTRRSSRAPNLTRPAKAILRYNIPHRLIFGKTCRSIATIDFAVQLPRRTLFMLPAAAIETLIESLNPRPHETINDGERIRASRIDEVVSFQFCEAINGGCHELSESNPTWDARRLP